MPPLHSFYKDRGDLDEGTIFSGSSSGSITGSAVRCHHWRGPSVLFKESASGAGTLSGARIQTSMDGLTGWIDVGSFPESPADPANNEIAVPETMLMRFVRYTATVSGGSKTVAVSYSVRLLFGDWAFVS